MGADSPEEQARKMDQLARELLHLAKEHFLAEYGSDHPDDASAAVLAVAAVLYAEEMCAGVAQDERPRYLLEVSEAMHVALLAAASDAMAQLRTAMMRKLMTPKPGWKEQTLGDIIPEAATEPLTKVINELKAALRAGGLDGPTAHKRLIEVLEPHREALAVKGVDVKFLAYSLENSLRQGML